MEFDVGKEFEEDLAGVDDRKCMVRIRTLTTDRKKRNINDLRPFVDDICKPFCVATPKMSSVLSLLEHSY